jgi:hypothetical protein
MTPKAKEIIDALADSPVIAVYGALGTGRTTLAGEVAAELGAIGIDVVRLDAANAHALDDLNAAVEERIGLARGDLGLREISRDVRVRVVVDNAHAIYDAPWVSQFQDLWRGFLTSPSVLNRVSALFLGRPVFRQALGGRGSPLLNVGNEIWVEPLNEESVIAMTGVAEEMAALIVTKTGGHPALSTRLGSDLLESADVGQTYRDFCVRQSSYLADLVDDHGIEAKFVLRELLESPSLPEAEVRDAFDDPSDSTDVVRDLESSGLLRRDGKNNLLLSASILRDHPDIKSYIRATGSAGDVPTSDPGMHTEAARLLYIIENQLRERIVDWLGNEDRRWWPMRVPNQLRNAEKLWLGERASRFPPSSPLHPVMYLTVGELLMLPEAGENWPIFDARWRIDQKSYQTIRDDIIAIRNKVSHNRPVTENEVVVLRTAATRLRLLGLDK